MSATEILALQAASSADGGDYVEIVQNGTARKVTLTNLFASTANGADGLSAYQLAVQHGYVGSVEQWLASLVGPQGTRGQAGNNGLYGPQGLKGDPGAQGPEGPRGRVGDTGRGLPGATGPAGPAGKSAYDLAVQQGYQGSLNQWMLSLKGLKGDKGDTGNVGPQGPQGDHGIQGEQGEMGPIGLMPSLQPTSVLQTSPSDVWIVNHNLGYRPSTIKVLSSGGVEMWTEIVHNNVNQFTVLLDQPNTGVVLYL